MVRESTKTFQLRLSKYSPSSPGQHIESATKQGKGRRLGKRGEANQKNGKTLQGRSTTFLSRRFVSALFLKNIEHGRDRKNWNYLKYSCGKRRS